MSAENQDQDFQKLQRLLKLKRHEQPHPRYFKEFSAQITARIHAGDVKSKDIRTFEDVVAQAPWLQRIWQAIEGKPAVSGVFAAALCGLILAGVYYAGNTTPTLPTLATNQPEASAENPLANTGFLANAPVSGGSMNPAAVLNNPSPSLFNGSLMTLPTTPVSFKSRGTTNGF
jgi:hypothetical protein